ncbi:MAG: HPr family phosphocarrier protein [Alphaproteobacteria bacterium]|nr:HPr family phosphocarrier protein [Alphaproteobacteria bacterium]
MSDTAETELTICNQKGLHARAAAAFVKCVSEYDADVTVEKDGQVVDGSSILSLMMLAASKGVIIKVRACGENAQEVINNLTYLVNSRFGEEE